MDLVVIGDSKFEKFFDEVLPEENYFVAKLAGKECAFLNTDNNFSSSLEIVKSIGVSRILEITNEELDSDRVNMAEDMGLIYSGFSVTGKEEYIKPLIEVAINASNNSKDTGLTEREREVLKLVSDGLSNKDIAKKLFLSEKTVKNHLNNIFKKIEVTDRTNAALYAVRNNMF